MSAELDLAQELVELLQQMDLVKSEMETAVKAYQELDVRRLEILTSLNDGAGKKAKTAPKPKAKEPDKTVIDNGTSVVELETEPVRTTAGEMFDKALAGKITPATAAKIATDAKLTPDVQAAIQGNITALREQADKPVPEPTPEQQAAEKEAMELYEAGVEKRSDAQMRMIFAILGNHNLRGENEQKQVIWGVIAEQHHGETLDSTKNLSKAWATGLIDFLNKAKPGTLNKYLKEPF